ncbi:hypothetical protein P154DRAFT_546361 [Amniculicola lignicola CBS 123094]|uniref:Uncharacterized protein n=1 Tax=Amniculicola lignicola CBS 123094 TaxID=1392246 RepID=A0A6A5WBX9_9PLEO|nr:hypothetical protein P154DRAFT_546361 [Amniculicola lignicola CBS 123094]
MDEGMLSDLMAMVAMINTALDASSESWRDQLHAARSITAFLELFDTTPNDERRKWQLSVIDTFQRLAYADADSGGVQDIGNWCLRQSLSLLQTYPENVDLLKLVGTNWLLRAQKSLAKIHVTERDSSSSGASQQSKSEEQRHVSRATIEAEARLWTADYVEARGILLPATDYLKRAVDAARAQGLTTACLLTKVCEPH